MADRISSAKTLMTTRLRSSSFSANASSRWSPCRRDEGLDSLAGRDLGAVIWTNFPSPSLSLLSLRQTGKGRGHARREIFGIGSRRSDGWGRGLWCGNGGKMRRQMRYRPWWWRHTKVGVLHERCTKTPHLDSIVHDFIDRVSYNMNNVHEILLCSKYFFYHICSWFVI